MAVITALTAQNTQGVSAIHLPPPSFVEEQIRMIFADIAVAAVKVGMLGTSEIVEAVARALGPCRDIPIVVDPVLVATSGATLGDETVVDALRDALFPLATLVTPNLPEAARLADLANIQTTEEIENAARELRRTFPTAWLLKGGHGAGSSANDFLLSDHGAMWFEAPRVATRNTHGTGCTLSSAVAAHLAKGASLPEAVRLAKAYLSAALTGADRLHVGDGAGPVDHFFAWR